MGFEDFAKDKKTVNAVIRSIEIIGDEENPQFHQGQVSNCSLEEFLKLSEHDRRIMLVSGAAPISW
jgi:hypothetical protein